MRRLLGLVLLGSLALFLLLPQQGPGWSFGPHGTRPGPLQHTTPTAHDSAPPEPTHHRSAGTESGTWKVLGTFALAFVLAILPPLGAGVAPAPAETPTATSAVGPPPSRRYLNFTGFPFPLGPFTERKTVMTELIMDRVYRFEQSQDLGGITANVASLVFRMRDNRLLVYNPVAPTEEFLQQLKGLNSGGVAHILLGTTPYEHKIYLAPFSREFPSAKVWAVPDQWSWPVDLPGPLLGINTTGGQLVDTAGESGAKAYANAPDLTAEFEVKLLRPQQRLGFGYAAVEAAVLHKDTKVLALTDALVNVPAKPTEVYDEAGLLAVGDNTRNGNTVGNLVLKAATAVNWRGSMQTQAEALWAASDAGGEGSAQERIQRGWERNTLLSLYFGPSPSSLVDPHPSFQSLTDRWLVAPVTDSLIYRSDRVKPELARWVDDVARWDIQMIAPSHFAARPGTGEDLRAAFAPTLAKAPSGANEANRPYNTGDAQLLEDISDLLQRLRVI